MPTLDPSNYDRDLTVGEVAQRSGVAVSTIHFYESKGLIKGWRSEGNQRRFSRDVLRRVAVIKVAQRLGISLTSIAAAFGALPKDRSRTAEDWKRMSEIWRAELDDRIAKLTRLRDNLDRCIGCGCLSIRECPLRNPWDELSEAGPGPRLLDPQ